MGRAAGKVERSRAAGKRSKWDHRDISSQATAPHKDRMGTPEFGPELTAAKTINPARAAGPTATSTMLNVTVSRTSVTNCQVFMRTVSH